MAGYDEKIIDFRDSLSSISLLKVTQVFENMEAAEILEIRGSDMSIRKDLFKVLPEEAYELIHSEESDADDDFYRVRIRKCKDV